MAITFPRALPEVNGYLPFGLAEFDPLFDIAMNPSRGGSQQVVGLGPDLWQMAFSSMQMDYQQAMELLAWLHTLRGGQRLFKAWHPLRKFPYAYRDTGWAGLTYGGDSFTGTVHIEAISVNRDALDLSGLPNDFQFSVGDFISFPITNGSQALHRVVEATTETTGGEATISIEPRVVLGAEDDVDATLERPWCLACIDASSIRGPLQANQAATVSFRAVQTYDPV